MEKVENMTTKNVENGTSGKTGRLLSDSDLDSVVGGCYNGHVYMKFGVQGMNAAAPPDTSFRV